MEVVARGAMGGKIVSNFSKRLQQEGSNRVVQRRNSVFTSMWQELLVGIVMVTVKAFSLEILPPKKWQAANICRWP